MEINNSELGALIYFLDFDKTQWRDGVNNILQGISCDIESRPHITTLYGFDHDRIEMEELRACIADYTKVNRIDIELGDIRVFENNTDVLYISVTSYALTELNDILRSKFTHTNSFQTYIPHLTLAFAQPGSTEHLIGYQTSPEALGLTNLMKGSFYYLTPGKEKVLIS